MQVECILQESSGQKKARMSVRNIQKQLMSSRHHAEPQSLALAMLEVARLVAKEILCEEPLATKGVFEAIALAKDGNHEEIGMIATEPLIRSDISPSPMACEAHLFLRIALGFASGRIETCDLPEYFSKLMRGIALLYDNRPHYDWEEYILYFIKELDSSH